MKNINLLNNVKENLLQNGASLIGFCSLAILPEDVRTIFTTGISIGLKLDSSVLPAITDGPTLEYLDEYKRVNTRLDTLSRLAADLLNKSGCKTDHWNATDSRVLSGNVTKLPHKTLATLSGLGWIGKSALLITKKYGPAIRFTSVLTNLVVDLPDKSITKSQCDNCTSCVTACPGSAPSGIHWKQGMEREKFFDADSCRKTARRLAKERIGIEYTFCGICIAVCPWTQKYCNN